MPFYVSIENKYIERHIKKSRTNPIDLDFALGRRTNGELMKMQMWLLMPIYINAAFQCFSVDGRQLYGPVIKHSPVAHELGYFAFQKYAS